MYRVPSDVIHLDQCSLCGRLYLRGDMVRKADLAKKNHLIRGVRGYVCPECVEEWNTRRNQLKMT